MLQIALRAAWEPRGAPRVRRSPRQSRAAALPLQLREPALVAAAQRLLMRVREVLAVRTRAFRSGRCARSTAAFPATTRRASVVPRRAATVRSAPSIGLLPTQGRRAFREPFL